jgi:hypothetical protein
MSDYIEVSLIILGESTDEDTNWQIVEDIRRANGRIVDISYTENTNTIYVSAHLLNLQ